MRQTLGTIHMVHAGLRSESGVRLIVPSVYALVCLLAPRRGATAPVHSRTEWHVLVEEIAADGGERVHHLIVALRPYGDRTPWTISAPMACAEAMAHIRAIGEEVDWHDAPPAVRRVVERYLGLAGAPS